MASQDFLIQKGSEWRQLSRGEHVRLPLAGPQGKVSFQTARRAYQCKKCKKSIPGGAPYARVRLTGWDGAYAPILGGDGPRCIPCSPVAVRVALSASAATRPPSSTTRTPTALPWTKKTNQAGHTVSPRVRGLVQDKPPGWEYLVLAGALHDALRRDASTLAVHPAPAANPLLTDEAWQYVISLTKNLGLTVAHIDKVVNRMLPTALGAPGTAGDPDELINVAMLLAQVHRYLTADWKADVAVKIWFELYRTLSLLDDAGLELVRRIEQFSASLDSAAPRIPLALQTRTPLDLNIVLDVYLPQLADIKAETSRVGSAVQGTG